LLDDNASSSLVGSLPTSPAPIMIQQERPSRMKKGRSRAGAGGMNVNPGEFPENLNAVASIGQGLVLI
jgi:hypothetical protein